jgi:hypothetical protein
LAVLPVAIKAMSQRIELNRHHSHGERGKQSVSAEDSEIASQYLQ